MEQSCSFEVDIAAKDIESFSRLTGDWNPLHNDPEYARTTEFGRPIGHGAFLVGLVSRVLGMHIPGKRSLILSMRVQFPKPLFFPAKVRVDGRLKSYTPERGGGGVVHVSITDAARLWTLLEGEVIFSLHVAGDPVQAPTPIPTPVATANGAARRLLITGGTGGLGTIVCPALAAQYPIFCLARAPEALKDKVNKNIDYCKLDLEEDGALEQLLAQTSPDSFYGVVHLSAPPTSRAYVSDDPAAVRRQLRHAVEVPLHLAKWARRPGSTVKRIVLLGSTAGTKYPQSSHGAYSLAKAAMEHLAKLLVLDMAAQGATVNVVLPTAVPVGLNAGMSDRARKVLLGKMPTGRLLEGQDIANIIAFLLSEAAGQINGASIFVDGGLVEHAA